VRQAFVRVWRTLHHERLRYPSTTTGRMAIAPEMKGQGSIAVAEQPAKESTVESAADNKPENAKEDLKTDTNGGGDSQEPPRDCCS